MENTNNNQLMAMEENKGFIADLTATRNTMFCSLKATTEKEKAILFKASNNPDKRIGDVINETINVKDVFCEVVTCVNKETGEATECPRIVLIDDKGIGYQSVSLGIYSAVKKLFAVYGMPTYETALKLKVKQITKGEKKLLTLDIA